MKICGIYCFNHTETGRRYIGSSLDVFRRRKIHELDSKGKSPQCFSSHLFLLGISNFTFEVLEECLPERRFERETFWISFFNSSEVGFNVISDPGKGWDYNFTEDMRFANSRGQKESVKAVENVKRMHDLNRNNPSHAAHIHKLGKSRLGTKLSLDHRLKISTSLKNNPTNVAQCRAMADANRGKKYSKERRESLSQSMKNSSIAKAQVRALHKLHIGMKRSPATCKAISEAARRRKGVLGKKRSPAAVLNMTTARRNRAARERDLKDLVQ